MLAVWWLLGERIKKMAQEYQVATMAEFFEKRYQSKFLKIFSSTAIFVFFIPYSAAVFIGLSYLFKLNFNTEYWHALMFMGVFTAVYMILGGYRSMSAIDVIFSALMIFGSGVVIVSVLGKGGGLAAATSRTGGHRAQVDRAERPARRLAPFLPGVPDVGGPVRHAAAGAEILRGEGQESHSRRHVGVHGFRRFFPVDRLFFRQPDPPVPCAGKRPGGIRQRQAGVRLADAGDADPAPSPAPCPCSSCC